MFEEKWETERYADQELCLGEVASRSGDVIAHGLGLPRIFIPLPATSAAVSARADGRTVAPRKAATFTKATTTFKEDYGSRIAEYRRILEAFTKAQILVGRIRSSAAFSFKVGESVVLQF